MTHDWGCVLGWNIISLYPQHIKAICGLDVPYSRSGIDPARDPKDPAQYWYITDFQPVGKAEAEWDADLERHLWAMYAGISNDTPKGTWLSQQDFPADTKFPDTLPAASYPPEVWPDWLTEEEFKYYVLQFKTCGLFGPISWYRNMGGREEISAAVGDKTFDMPVAYLYGAGSDVGGGGYTTEEEQRRGGYTWDGVMKRWFSDLRVFEEIPDCGHWLPLEQAELVTGKILAFLASA